MAKTPLFAQHELLGAKITDFFGWDMPLHYGSQVEEHLVVRKDAGMFDVSHMTIVDVLGAGGRQFLKYLLANDIDILKPGQAMYSCMLNQHGGIIDDLIVYNRSFDSYRLVLNAGTKEKDLAWIQEKALGFSIGLLQRQELSIIAVQGPKAIEKALKALTPSQMDPVSTLRPFETIDISEWSVARTGYTGEDGLEIMLPKEEAEPLWQSLIALDVSPCGLGARDSLRLEAGMLLYGQDMDDSFTPLESGLAWTVKLDSDDRDFIGKGALLAQKQHGLTKKMVGLVLETKGILRAGQKVVLADGSEGVITSGGYSPSLEKSIAFARIPLTSDESAHVEIRGKSLPVKLTRPRFIQKGKIIV